jgi:Holliday junction resolvase RusA-like endonuclease
MSLKLVIYGRPVPKKNSPVMVPGNRPRLLPSKAFREYEKDALKQVQQWGNVTFEGEVQVTCLYWFKDWRWRSDLVGLLQGTSDLLEKSGIIANDRNIYSYDGSRIMGLSPEPRVEISITKREVLEGI